MGVKHPDFKNESAHLSEVCEMLSKEIEKKENEIKNYKGELVSIRKNMWENARHGFGSNETEAMIEANQYIAAIKNEENSYRFTKALLDKYRRLLYSPYFACVDFRENGEKSIEKVYMGLYSFIDIDTMEVVVHDWRAPISSVFYEYELGPAEYKTEKGSVNGEISLKRQFKIKDSTLQYMFDSSVKIDDEMLQEILSGNASEKMRNIVTTIQKEQNRAIRFDDGSMLVVQGAAGSGKTSIALHRIAYLLYKDRNLSSSNIIIFSPSQVFNDYISNVLPELGENNVIQTTFSEYTARLVSRGFRLESHNDHMEYLLSEKTGHFNDIRRKGYTFKSSPEFLTAVKEYSESLVSGTDYLKDLYYKGRAVIKASELRRIYEKNDRSLPVNKRLDIVRERALYLLGKVQEQKKVEMKKELENDFGTIRDVAVKIRFELHKEFKLVKDEILRMTRVGLYDAYRGFYKSIYYLKAGRNFGLTDKELEEIRHYTIDNLNSRIMNHEDASLLVFIRCVVDGAPDSDEIKHVVIDEAQDYSPMQYEIFKRLFPKSSFTILGDTNQSINPYRDTASFSSTVDIFGRPDTEVLSLSKSYRSTKEITEFAKGILQADIQVEELNRAGKLPEVVRLDSSNGIKKVVLDDIRSLLENGMKSITLLCRTREECIQLHKLLKDDMKLELVTKDDDLFKKGINILPSYLCKGLEFDAVLVYGASADDYHNEGDRKLLYTLCTRALHRLIVYYQGELSPILQAVDKKLYRHVEYR